MDLPMPQKQDHGHREQTGKGCQGGGEGWSGRLGQTDVKFSCIGWISTDNNIQYNLENYHINSQTF